MVNDMVEKNIILHFYGRFEGENMLVMDLPLQQEVPHVAWLGFLVD